MSRLIASFVVAAFVVTAMPLAHATSQQDKMKSCNTEAKDLKGDARKAFMKKCLSASSKAANPAAEACAAKAVGKDGKPLAGAAKNSFMKKCEKEAAGK